MIKSKDIIKKIPKGWSYFKLGEVINLVNGRAYGKEELLAQGKYKVIRIQNLNGGENWYYSNLELEESKYCNKGDLLFAWSTTFGPYFWTGEKAIFHYHIWNLIITQKIDKKFAFYYLNEITEELQKSSHGVAMLHITKGLMEQWDFPLPPLPEQHRIVKKLDSLFERLDKGIALTKENLEHCRHLLPSALNEVFEKAENQWNLLSVKDLSTQIQYGYTGKSIENSKYYYLRITDIQNNKIEWPSTPYSDISEKEVAKYLLNKGDIVFARTGATAGKSYLFDDNVNSIFASYLIRVVTNKNKIQSEFLWFYFQSPKYWEQVADKTIGAAQPNVNGQKLSEIIVPVPNLPTQQKIVTYLNQFSAKQQMLQQHYTKQLQHLQSLKASLLDAAFRGEL